MDVLGIVILGAPVLYGLYGLIVFIGRLSSRPPTTPPYRHAKLVFPLFVVGLGIVCLTALALIGEL